MFQTSALGGLLVLLAVVRHSAEAAATAAGVLAVAGVQADGKCPSSAEEEGTEAAAMVQLMTQPQRQSQSQSQRATPTSSAGRDFDYKCFQLGDWPEAASMCGEGFSEYRGLQAPINIAVAGADYEQLPNKSWPTFYAKDGGCKQAYFVDKGTAWQVDFMSLQESLECTNLEMEWNGKVYALVQFHFHTLSEDTLDFQPLPLQLHMVHLASDGSVAVVGVLIETRGTHTFNENRFLRYVFETGFDTSHMVSAPWWMKFNPYRGLLKQGAAFWHYQGSFTTPPCTMGVDFLLMQSPVYLSTQHVARYQERLMNSGKCSSYGLNNRPIQPLNGRKITTGRFMEVCPERPVPDCGPLDPEHVRRCEEEG